MFDSRAQLGLREPQTAKGREQPLRVNDAKGEFSGAFGRLPAMNVTNPVITSADLYFSWMEPKRSQKKRVEAAIEAKVNDRQSYTTWN